MVTVELNDEQAEVLLGFIAQAVDELDLAEYQREAFDTAYEQIDRQLNEEG